jgi:Protein HRI1
MYPQPDGTVLEKGEMVKRETGRLTPYEEVWQDYDPEVTGTDKKVVEVVLSCKNEGNGLKGMVSRIGGWIQGVLRMGNDITAVRWQWIVVEVSIP